MPRVRSILVSDDNNNSKASRPPFTPDAKENQMIFLAVELAEKQLREGTASSQVITHFLKLASSKERLEKEIMEKQKELLEEKTKQLKSSQVQEELYLKALSAMKTYTGGDEPNDDEN